MTDELAALRRQVDDVNARLVDVLQERARLVRRIAEHKRAHGLPAVDVAREREMMDRLLAGAPEGFDEETLRRLLAEVFAASRAIVETSGDGLRVDTAE